jgi:hypothetical protein
VAPDSRIIAGPLGNEEAILYADLDLDIGVRMKLRHDFAGRYNRPDIFEVTVNAKAPHIFAIANATPNGWGEAPAVVPGGHHETVAIEPIHQRAIGLGGGGDILNWPPSRAQQTLTDVARITIVRGTAIDCGSEGGLP